MKLALALVAAALVAGCTTPSATNDPSESSQTNDGSGLECISGESRPLKWSSDEAEPGSTTPFTVVPGAAKLDLQWKDPTTSAGAWAVIVTDPEGNEVFAQERGAGVSSGSTTIGMGSMRQSSNVEEPPLAGDYTLSYRADGPVEGATLTALVTGCW